MTAPDPERVVVLVDDVRSFRDGRPSRVARSADEAIRFLRTLHGTSIAELWLDHDLAGRNDTDVTVMPVVAELVAAAERGTPYSVETTFVHTSNPRGWIAINDALTAAGYSVRRSYDQRVFVNRRTEDDTAAAS